jgi:hypothetical protein
MSRCEDDRCQPAVRLKLDLRLGAGGPAPRQAHGPVSVNLFNGNAALTLASPAMQTVGGEVGLSLNYNSGVQRATGLTASYYDGMGDSGAIGAREVPARVSTARPHGELGRGLAGSGGRRRGRLGGGVRTVGLLLT